MVRKALIASLSLAALASACGNTGLPGNQGQKKLLDGSAVGKARCESSEGDDRPFLVEWDSTDISTFEAKATRDMLFVKYEGCKLTVLYNCADPGLPGSLGKYGEIEWTSGSVDGFDVENEGELHAKLPLGVTTLSGKIEAGEKLHLKYFISGMRNATRSRVTRGDLAAVSGCEGATHFVSGYNLGAFELFSSERTAGSAGVDNPVASGGGSVSKKSSNLKKAGSISNCTTATQTECRVPVRLSLTRIADGDSQAGGGSGSGSGAGAGAGASSGVVPPPSRGTGKDATEYWAMVEQAKKRFDAGDGSACLEQLDRLDRKFPKGLAQDSVIYTNQMRAQCEMRAGKCEAGKKRYAESLKAFNEKKKRETGRYDMTDEQMKKNVEQSATIWCSGGAPDQQYEREMTQATLYMKDSQDAAGCIQREKDYEVLARKVWPGLKDDKKSYVGVVATQAALCLARLKRCGDARAVFDSGNKVSYEQTFQKNGMSPADFRKYLDSSFEGAVKECKGKLPWRACAPG